MTEMVKKQEVKNKYAGKQWAEFSVKDKKGEEISRFALRFCRRDGFYYCYSSNRTSDARDKVFRRPTWADIAAASIYMLGRLKTNICEEFGTLKNYSIKRDQEADLRFSPVLVGKTSRVPLPVTIEDTGEILEDNFHLSYNTAMKTLLVLMKTEQQGAVECETAKVVLLRGID